MKLTEVTMYVLTFGCSYIMSDALKLAKADLMTDAFWVGMISSAMSMGAGYLWCYTRIKQDD